MLKLILRLILFLVLGSVIAFLSYLGVVYFSLEAETFYSSLFLVIGISSLVILFLRIFWILNPRRSALAFAALFAFYLIIGSIYEFNQKRIEKIPVISDRGIELSDYEPFANDSRVAILSEASTLKIEKDLPVLDGATALYPLYSAFVQALYPEGIYLPTNDPVRCGGTIEAYDNLIDGKVDMIFAAKPSDKQTEAAKAKGLELRQTPIGREAFVFFVNARNPVTSLSSRQIKDIYSGKIKNWKEVGGKNEEIIAFQRPEGSGSQTMLQKIMEGETLTTPPVDEIPGGMGDIIRQTSDYKNFKNAIGYSFLIYATELVRSDQIKLIAVDGIAPSKASIRDKSYPFVADFYAVTAGSQNPHLESFKDWIISTQGKTLIEKTGYTPLD